MKKENGLSADSGDKENKLQVWRKGRKQGVWEKENWPGIYILINREHEETS